MPVYFIRAGESGPVKIGTTSNAAERFRQLQRCHYETLTMIRLLDGSSNEERALHQRFASQRVKFEWFAFDAAMLGDLGMQDLPLPQEPTIGRWARHGMIMSAIMKAKWADPEYKALRARWRSRAPAEAA